MPTNYEWEIPDTNVVYSLNIQNCVLEFRLVVVTSGDPWRKRNASASSQLLRQCHEGNLRKACDRPSFLLLELQIYSLPPPPPPPPIQRTWLSAQPEWTLEKQKRYMSSHNDQGVCSLSVPNEREMNFLFLAFNAWKVTYLSRIKV
jgi:hypothetical protein